MGRGIAEVLPDALGLADAAGAGPPGAGRRAGGAGVVTVLFRVFAATLIAPGLPRLTG